MITFQRDKCECEVVKKDVFMVCKRCGSKSTGMAIRGGLLSGGLRSRRGVSIKGGGSRIKQHNEK